MKKSVQVMGQHNPAPLRAVQRQNNWLLGRDLTYLSIFSYLDTRLEVLNARLVCRFFNDVANQWQLALEIKMNFPPAIVNALGLQSIMRLPVLKFGKLIMKDQTTLFLSLSPMDLAEHPIVRGIDMRGCHFISLNILDCKIPYQRVLTLYQKNKGIQLDWLAHDWDLRVSQFGTECLKNSSLLKALLDTFEHTGKVFSYDCQFSTQVINCHLQLVAPLRVTLPQVKSDFPDYLVEVLTKELVPLQKIPRFYLGNYLVKDIQKLEFFSFDFQANIQLGWDNNQNPFIFFQMDENDPDISWNSVLLLYRDSEKVWQYAISRNITTQYAGKSLCSLGADLVNPKIPNAQKTTILRRLLSLPENQYEDYVPLSGIGTMIPLRLLKNTYNQVYSQYRTESPLDPRGNWELLPSEVIEEIYEDLPTLSTTRLTCRLFANTGRDLQRNRAELSLRQNILTHYPPEVIEALGGLEYIMKLPHINIETAWINCTGFFTTIKPQDLGGHPIVRGRDPENRQFFCLNLLDADTHEQFVFTFIYSNKNLEIDVNTRFSELNPTCLGIFSRIFYRHPEYLRKLKLSLTQGSQEFITDDQYAPGRVNLRLVQIVPPSDERIQRDFPDFVVKALGIDNMRHYPVLSKDDHVGQFLHSRHHILGEIQIGWDCNQRPFIHFSGRTPSDKFFILSLYRNDDGLWQYAKNSLEPSFRAVFIREDQSALGEDLINPNLSCEQKVVILQRLLSLQMGEFESYRCLTTPGLVEEINLDNVLPDDLRSKFSILTDPYVDVDQVAQENDERIEFKSLRDG